ncbi:SIS domain-containing protein [Spongiactinospora sp. TRM90649]|uniref:D-sedoheptulose-7-phosphate isomerase n=1 Tax=Spongiactinospora sp. TRM90649 TaxID=3031114 RepID=UPI0023F890A0|nr:SIS domain-containing protein [Spongiactinospora sp. TRM90649]MDF5751740.1 SIS domain-containing protein [Spongiactinospora sp. TRM90649]
MTGTLYPFLRRDPLDVTGSTAAKARESLRLRLHALGEMGPALTACAAATAAALRGGGRIFVFGNGGSATDAESMAGACTAAGLPAISLTADTALVTALGNDVGFEVIFARQLAALGGPGDVAVALSTSGGSVNVLRGLAEAERLGMVTVGFAGAGGGRMAHESLAAHLFVVPSSSVHRIQEAQATLYHLLVALVSADPR